MEVSREDEADLAPFLQTYFSKEHGLHLAPRCPSSVLRKGVVNRILYYTGSFNPPHAGHLAILKHAFDHCDRHYNVVAVVVEMASDQTLQHKFRDQPGTLLLNSAQRVQIWAEALCNRHQGGNRDSDQNMWCWVVSGYDFCAWEDGFDEMMLKLAHWAAPEYDVRVTHLIGGDYIRLDPRAENLSSKWGLIKMPWCSEWERIIDQGEPNDGAEKATKLNKIGDGQDQEDLTPSEESFSQLGLGAGDGAGAVAVWTCEKHLAKTYTIRFISAQEPMVPSPSSTAVRRAIENSKPEELLDNLRRSGALAPDLLASFIRE
ncbi:uncharacterized protein PG998_001067 [Apiospora kogelbergensis]|uniref:uncharacterized protein n=1 Tax=Apiospora kogelbergensis TaxID=1337665 RepID=UPI00312D383F